MAKDDIETFWRPEVVRLTAEVRRLKELLNKKYGGWNVGDVDRQSGAFTEQEIADAKSWK